LLSGHAYCWGRNTHGQLGDGTTNDRLVPTRVSGSISFASIDADNQITCGSEAETGRGYCWGQNSEGQIGDGTKTDRLAPAIVGGGNSGGNIRFSRVEAADLTCGIELVTGVAYCWGHDTTVPTVVAAGGLRFSSISTAYGWACGVAAQTGHGYCWDSELLPALVPHSE
jgi:serine/threonine-protein kinase